MQPDESSILIDEAYLTSLVRVAAQDSQLIVGDWQVQPIYGGFQLNSDIYRLQGSALLADPVQSWSLVLKAIRPDPAFDKPQDYRYWKREVLAYESGLLETLPGPLVAPRCYDICDRPDGSYWLFLQDVRQAGEPDWSLENYARVARCLGEFNGAFLAGCPLPQAHWIRSDWLQDYLQHARPAVEFVRHNPRHPVVQGIFPGTTLAQVLAFWDLYPHLLQILDGLPQTFCHRDAFERNLFLRGKQVVAIDWGYAGTAPVGAELAPLIAAGIAMGNFPSSRARELDQACFQAYLAGLKRAGWHLDERQVRLGFTLTFGLRYILANVVGETIPTLLDADRRERMLQSFGMPTTGEVKSDPYYVAYCQGIVFEILRQLGPGFTLKLLVRTMSYMLQLRREMLLGKTQSL